MFSISRKFMASCFLAVLFAHGSAQAATGKTVAASALTQPQPSPTTLTGTSGPWNYRCVFPGANVTTLPVLCVMEQPLAMQDVQKKTVPLGAVIFARAQVDNKTPLSARPWRLTVETPLGLSLKTQPRVAADKSGPLTLVWQSCVSTGCLASADLTDDQVKDLRHAKQGHIMADKLAGGVLTINFEMVGADDGLKALDGWISPSASH